MPIETRTRAFVEANVEHYLDVMLALRGFEGQIEAVLRSIWRDFAERRAAVGIRLDSPQFKKNCGEVANLFLEARFPGGLVGIAFQFRDASDPSKRLSAYSYIWIKDPALRRSFDDFAASHTPEPFIHEFEESYTYVSAYLDLANKTRAIDLLRDSVEALLQLLAESPDFSKTLHQPL